ncbi:MAG: carboxypeptidase-like regulatory domain-containing protein [Bacteroidetes bacterium]|nr:carboxypeptidase-like regulatory domain-containing protein [Bacteroidota bacterium]MBS1539349.1 carboxypeptidase-like regulatory domain-containing protein [Bacteroidota bacterium]
MAGISIRYGNYLGDVRFESLPLPTFKMIVKRNFFILAAIAFCVLALRPDTSAQARRRVVQLSGLVTDTTGNFLPGVNFYVPKAGRGTTSLGNGFFSMPVLIGDTVLITSVGFRKQTYVVPEDAKEFTSVIFEMNPDVTFLKEVVITMPTEELFKEAVLALNVPLDNTGIDPKNLNSELLALMVRTTPMDGNANYRYYINQYSNSFGDKFHPIYNPFLNPLNWVKFIKDIKKKKKQEQSRY